MKGLPKFFNTKQDYLNVLAMPETEVSTAKKRELLEDLLKYTVDWFSVGTLANREEGVEDETHKVVESEQQDGDTTTVTYTQYELRTNYGAQIFRVGFTIEEVQNLLASL